MKKLLGIILSLALVLVLFSFDFSVVRLVQGKPGEYNIIGNIIESKEKLYLTELNNSDHAFLEGTSAEAIEAEIRSNYSTNGRININKISTSCGKNSVKLTVSRGFTERYVEYYYYIFANSDLLITIVGSLNRNDDVAYRIMISNTGNHHLSSIKDLNLKLINKTNGIILATKNIASLSLNLNPGEKTYSELIITKDEIEKQLLNKDFDYNEIIIASRYSLA